MRNTIVTWYELANECAAKLPQISDETVAAHVAAFFKTGALVGFSVAINPFAAMAVGFLGLPGAALVVALKLLM